MIPTRRLAWLVALTAPAWFLSVAAGVSALLLLLLLAIDLLMLPGRKQMRVRRAFPDSVGLGDEAQADYHLQSDWPLQLRVDVHDALTPALQRRAETQRVAPFLIGSAVLPARGRA